MNMSKRQFKNLGIFTTAIMVLGYVAGLAFLVMPSTSCTTVGSVKPSEFVEAVVDCTDVQASIEATASVVQCLATQDPAACLASAATALKVTIRDVSCVVDRIARQCHGDAGVDTWAACGVTAQKALNFISQNRLMIIRR
jgi:hypothetical protein